MTVVSTAFFMPYDFVLLELTKYVDLLLWFFQVLTYK